MKKPIKEIELKSKIKSSEKYSKMIVSENITRVKELHAIKMNDEWNNKFHLSSYSGLINDPNGLVKFKNKYHIFYQWAPFSPIHTLKHWGHFETKDFINYKHTGVAIEPSLREDKDGAYSGGSIVIDGKMYVYWTGNVKEFSKSDEERSAFILVGEWDEDKKRVINHTPLFEVDKEKYTGHFRDPKPFIINDEIYLLIGAQLKNKQGTLVLYKSSNPTGNFKRFGDIKILPSLGKYGFMWECPDYQVIGEEEFLIFSPQGVSFYGKNNENRDTVVFMQGKLDISNLTFRTKGKPQIIDHGFDFYAPQIFNNTNRKIMIGWAGAGKADSYATFKNKWAHNLTLSREIRVNNEGFLIQRPLEEYNNLRKEEIKYSENIVIKNRLMEIKSDIKDKIDISLSNNKNESIDINISNNKIKVSRDNMSFEQGEEFGYIRKREHYKKFSSIRIFIDNSLMEIYLNDGEFVFTSKYFLTGDLKLKIDKGNNIKISRLNPFNIKWEV